jgi:hypothetical protein
MLYMCPHTTNTTTGETPLEFVQRACAAVRASWATGGGSMTLTEEWEKLKLERASIGRCICVHLSLSLSLSLSL